MDFDERYWRKELVTTSTSTRPRNLVRAVVGG